MTFQMGKDAVFDPLYCLIFKRTSSVQYIMSFLHKILILSLEIEPAVAKEIVFLLAGPSQDVFLLPHIPQ